MSGWIDDWMGMEWGWGWEWAREKRPFFARGKRCDVMRCGERREVRGERLLLIIKRDSEGIGFTCVTSPISSSFFFFFALEYTQKDNACEEIFSGATCQYITKNKEQRTKNNVR